MKVIYKLIMAASIFFMSGFRMAMGLLVFPLGMAKLIEQYPAYATYPGWLIIILMFWETIALMGLGIWFMLDVYKALNSVEKVVTYRKMAL
jgi:hypothetical protein